MQHKRKTISGQDVLDAMKEMEFERFVEPLRRSLEGLQGISLTAHAFTNVDYVKLFLSCTLFCKFCESYFYFHLGISHPLFSV